MIERMAVVLKTGQGSEEPEAIRMPVEQFLMAPNEGTL
jgi:hypothetical protein